MLNYFHSLLTVAAVAVLVSGGSPLAQYSSQGFQPNVRYPIPFVDRDWIDEDANEAGTPSPPVSPRRRDVRPDLPSLPHSRMDEWGSPVRPPGDIDLGRPPNQASPPGTTAPRRGSISRRCRRRTNRN